MSLKSTIEDEIKKAMLAKHKERLTALRAVKSSILLAETEKGGQGELSTEAEMQILQKNVKQRQDSLEIYKKEGRNDLAEKEAQEIKVIEEFLPKQLDDDALEKEITSIIEETGASSMKDMGKVMGQATKKLAGKADNKRISMMVKNKLA